MGKKIQTSAAECDVCAPGADDHSSSDVSSRLVLKEPLESNAKKILKIPLLGLNCSFGIVTEDVEGPLPLKTVAERQRRKQEANVIVMFAIRRPGWGSCREHGEQLAQLAAQSGINFALVGIVKDRSADNQDLLEFYDNHFRYPIYQDERWNIFHAMGNRKISLLQLLTGYVKSRRRHNQASIETKLPRDADGWTKGGVLIFDKHVNLRYAYDEEYGEELDIAAIRKAIRAASKKRRVDDEGSSSRLSDSHSSIVTGPS